jgi:hypothetical protein
MPRVQRVKTIKIVKYLKFFQQTWNRNRCGPPIILHTQLIAIYIHAGQTFCHCILLILDPTFFAESLPTMLSLLLLQSYFSVQFTKIARRQDKHCVFCSFGCLPLAVSLNHKYITYISEFWVCYFRRYDINVMWWLMVIDAEDNLLNGFYLLILYKYNEYNYRLG